LRAQGLMVRVLFRCGPWLNRLLTPGCVGVRLEARHIEPAQIVAEPLQGLKADVQFPGNFELAGIAAKTGLARQNCLLETARLAAQPARAPIDEAQAIENRASNAELSVVLELNVLGRIVFPQSIHQAENPGVDQIFEQHLRGQSAMDPASHMVNMREMFQQKFLALRLT